MRKALSNAVLLIAALGAFNAACSDSGEAGETGPAGTAGTNGTNGAPGAAGATGPAGTSAPTPPTPSAPGAVYTLSNDATANAVFVYSRAADGTLTPDAAYPTGGRGFGAGLGDQGALVFDPSTKHFLAVNAGDDSISMLSLEDDGSLDVVAKVSSGGSKPISIAMAGSSVYVLNAGDGGANAANIVGFKIANGGLSRVANSTKLLSAAAPAPAQISFTPDGKILVVTEKGTNKIDTFVVTDGLASDAMVQASSGMTPFGFAFSASSQLIVSEAVGGTDGAGTASSYSIAANGMLTPKSEKVASGQSAPCWVTVVANHAYITNTKTNNVTAYTVSTDGAISLLNADGVTGMTGGNPIDVDASDDGKVLYTLNAKDHSISVFAIAADGSLAKKPDLVGLPESAIGLVAR